MTELVGSSKGYIVKAILGLSFDPKGCAIILYSYYLL